jgi:hypothetical protein
VAISRHDSTTASTRMSNLPPRETPIVRGRRTARQFF